MRLIDADTLIKDLSYLYTKNHIPVDMRAKETLSKIMEQPTAYDIGKVVTELNELDVTAIKRYEGGTFGNYKGTDYYIKKSDAIEIVKQGGVSDEVCEWKIFDNSLTDEPQWVYETACGKYVGEEHTSKAFVYCPYCGKKIKVME